MPSRLERTPFAEWWWTVDRLLLAMLIVVMVLGIVLCMAGSPPVAERHRAATFYFVNRQLFYLVPAFAVMVLVSFLSPRHVRRLALAIYVVAMALVVATLLFGAEVKGARRWISLAGIAIQPSEFVKPAFVILAAWAFSEGGRRQDVPGNIVGFLLFAVTITPLVLQPDIGQTMLITIVWCGLVFLSGLHLFWVLGLGGLGMLGLGVAYHLLPHVAARINRFIDPTSGDTFQVDNAIESFVQGGWMGKGPGEGTVKRYLPDSHTDFIFAVGGEEFGIVFSIALVTIFALVVLRGLVLSRRNEEPFCRLAAAGLVMLFGLQSVINLAVNVNLIPAKGMTLPFISYGGSSLISMGLAMGILLAVTRRRPRAVQLYRSEHAFPAEGARA